MHMFTKRNIIFRWLFILWAILIISVSSIPHLSVPNIPIGFRLDYLVHFGMYFVLAIFLVLWKIDKYGHFKKGQYIILILLGCLFAIADETHQLWIPERTFAWKDMLSNVLGFTSGFVFVSSLYNRYCVS